MYRRPYLDHAFPGIFIDELNEAHVTGWFAAVHDETGPGAANRCLTSLANMLTKAEGWGYRLENTNPCRSIRPNRKRRRERFLSSAELGQLGRVLAEDRAGGDKLKAVVASAIVLLFLTGCRSGEVGKPAIVGRKGQSAQAARQQDGAAHCTAGGKCSSRNGWFSHAPSP